ncbi:MAG: nucleotidyltransferase family protein [Elusimicrobia bacterium]|nr:nucleotidyltransferase family protein [Elusimicrobiota bacterium]
MKALILLGGLGTRLRPLTVDRPKPLLPILNRPFIAYQIDLLKKFGVREVVLGLGHKATAFRRQLGTGKEWGVKFIYSLEKEPLGTGGAIRHALDHLNGPAFILNGDVLSDFDLKALAETHRKAKADATLALGGRGQSRGLRVGRKRRAGLIRRFWRNPGDGNRGGS